MISHEIAIISGLIGQFYLHKNNDDYEKAGDEVKNLFITDIQVDETTVSITCSRLGLLIGKRGENIGNLEKFLNKKVKIFEAKDNLLNYLIPYPPMEDSESDYEYNPFPEDDIPTAKSIVL